MSEVDDLKKQVSVLEQRLRLYELPSPERAFYVGQKILNQQNDFLLKFDLAKEIAVNPKDDKIYDRAIDIFEKLTANATKLNNLYSELGLSGDEKKDTTKKTSFLDSALK